MNTLQSAGKRGRFFSKECVCVNRRRFTVGIQYTQYREIKSIRKLVRAQTSFYKFIKHEWQNVSHKLKTVRQSLGAPASTQLLSPDGESPL